MALFRNWRSAQKGEENDKCFFAICLCFFVAKTIISGIRDVAWLYMLAAALLGAGLTVAFAYLLERVHLRPINRILAFLGAHSLELYLSNMVWIEVFQKWNFSRMFGESAIISYVVIIVLCVLTSVLTKRISKLCVVHN